MREHRWPFNLVSRGTVLGALALLFGLLLAGGVILEFLGARALDAGGTVRSSGAYILTRDIEVTGPAAFYLDGDLINLDLNGKTISCRPAALGEEATIGINVKPGAAVKIYNGLIRGCDIGIHAVDAESVDVRSVDLSGVGYMGVDAAVKRLSIIGSKFSGIGGYKAEAYAIGINARARDSCRIEGNQFSELYRQATAAPDLVGEGVGIILGEGSSRCEIAHNIFENQRPVDDSIGVWVADRAEAALTSNLLVGFSSGFVGKGTIRARNNVLWLDPPGGNNSYGVYGGPGSELSGNLIVGFQNARSIKEANGELRVIK